MRIVVTLLFVFVAKTSVHAQKNLFVDGKLLSVVALHHIIVKMGVRLNHRYTHSLSISMVEWVTAWSRVQSTISSHGFIESLNLSVDYFLR